MPQLFMAKIGKVNHRQIDEPIRSDFSKVVRIVELIMITGFLILNPLVSRAGVNQLDWMLPAGQFGTVDEQGHVSYWMKIGDVECGEGMELPLHIAFNSMRDVGPSSPYLGQGWLVPFLESYFIQEDDNRFLMIQPNGSSNYFLRRHQNETTLIGSAGWKAQLGTNIITALSPSGCKITFKGGKIAQLGTASGRCLDWVYEGKRISEVREGGSTLLKVEVDGEGKPCAFLLNHGRRIKLTIGLRPKIRSVDKINVLAGVDQSINSLTYPDGHETTFAFGVDNENRPSLEIDDSIDPVEATVDNSKRRIFIWDPKTRIIVSENGWSYAITPKTAPYAGSSIVRTDAEGKKEGLIRDVNKATETLVVSSRRKVTYFETIGGSEKIRKIIDCDDLSNSSTVVYRCNYDASGEVIREYNNGTWTEQSISKLSDSDMQRIGIVRKLDSSTIAVAVKFNGIVKTYTLSKGNIFRAENISDK